MALREKKMANDKIYLDFEDVYEKAKQRTVLLLRVHSDHDLVIPEGDDEFKTLILGYYNEGVQDFRNRFFNQGTIKDYEDSVFIELTAELTGGGFKSLQGLLDKALLNYVLHVWYRNLGSFELGDQFRGDYELYANQVKKSSAFKTFVKPKSAPWY
jgi:hypothetical protein